MVRCVSTFRSPYEEDPFLGCYRCGAGEDLIQESVHPDEQETITDSYTPDECLWCSNCKGRVNEDYALWLSGNATWQLIETSEWFRG